MGLLGGGEFFRQMGEVENPSWLDGSIMISSKVQEPAEQIPAQCYWLDWKSISSVTMNLLP